MTKCTEKQVLADMASPALKCVKTIESLPWQHFINFEKRAENKDDKSERYDFI